MSLWWLVPLVIFAWPGQGSLFFWEPKTHEARVYYRLNTVALALIKAFTILYGRVLVWYYTGQEKKPLHKEETPSGNGVPAQPAPAEPPVK